MVEPVAMEGTHQHATPTPELPHLAWLSVFPVGWMLTALMHPLLDAFGVPVTLGVAYGIALLLTTTVLLRGLLAYGWSPPAMGIAWQMRWRWLLVMLGGFVVIGQTWLPVEALLSSFDLPMLWPERAAHLGDFRPLSLILVVLFGVLLIPFLEEVLFRGYLLSYLHARGWQSGWAILVAAVFFGLTHIALGPGLVVVATFIGLFTGWLTVRTGSITYAVLYHVLNNAWAYLGVPLLFE